MMWAKQSTAATITIGPVLDSTGAEYTGLVIGDLTIRKHDGSGAAMASAATLTHVDNGYYTLVTTTGNIDTLGRCQIRCNKSTYQCPVVEFMVLPATVYDALVTNATTAAGGLGDIQRMAGTVLTGRDIGASVLVSAGTGTGQLDFTSGVVKSNLAQILGTALTETSGQIAAAFKKFFDKATPTGTVNSLPDAVAGATGGVSIVGSAMTLSSAALQAIWDVATSGLTTAGSIGKALLDNWTTILSRLSASRAGYLDNLSAGAVALEASVAGIQNNTRTVIVVPEVIERPDSGTETYLFHLYLYDEVGNMEAPDSAPTLAIANSAGTDRSGRLGSTTGTLVNTGHYKWVYTNTSTDTLEQLLSEFTVVEGGATRLFGRSTLIVDTSAVDFSSSDRTKLDAVYNKLPVNNIGDETLLLAAIGSPAQASADFNATQKTSITTAATAATPTVTAGTVSDKTGYALTSAYDAAKTAATQASVDAVKVDTGNLVTRIPAALFAGITSLAEWLGLMTGKQTGNSTARTELRATGAGSGTFDETTDSLEALRDRGDAAWVTGGAGSAPTVEEIDAQLSITHGSGAWDGGSGGSGARTVAVTVDDGTDPIEDANVRLTKGSESYVQATDADGEVAFSIDDGTWTLVVTRPGYTFTPATIVVDGDEITTCSMTLVTVSPPTNPSLSAIQVLCLDSAGQPESGVAIDIRIITVPSGSQNIAFKGAKQTATSDGSGIARFEVVQGSVCEWKRGLADVWQSVAIDSDGVTNVTSVIGSP